MAKTRALTTQQSVAGKPARNKRGQYATPYDPKLAIAICERIAEGETLSGICKTEGMPDRTTFRKWVLADEDLRKAYEAARNLQAHSLFDEALDVTRQLKEDKDLDNTKVNAFRVALEHLRWSAGKLNPKEYGEKADPRGVVAVQIITPLNLGLSDRQRDPVAGENLYTLKATIEPEPGDTEKPNEVVSRQSATAPDGRPPMTPHPGDGG